jgi:hypothetical protein
MLETILPFAIKYNLKINTVYGVDATDALIQDVKNQTGTVFIIWEHSQLPVIAKGLGVRDVLLNWDAEDYDTVWIIRIKKGNATFSVEKENIAPSANCPF